MRACSACAILVVAIGILAAGQIKDEYWNRIPTQDKAWLTTTGYSGSRELSIMLFALTFETAELMGMVEFKASAEQMLGGNVIVVFVAPYDDEYFWPTDFDFTQGYIQAEIGYGDFLAIDDAFDGGELRSGTVARGVLRFPDEIDPGIEFIVWYDDESAQMGPVSFGSSASLATDTQLAVDFVRIPSVVAPGGSVVIEISTSPFAECSLIIYTRNGIVESPDISPRPAGSDGRATWVWQTDAQTPTGLVLLQATASVNGNNAAMLGSFTIADE